MGQKRVIFKYNSASQSLPDFEAGSVIFNLTPYEESSGTIEDIVEELTKDAENTALYGEVFVDHLYYVEDGVSNNQHIRITDTRIISGLVAEVTARKEEDSKLSSRITDAENDIDELNSDLSKFKQDTEHNLSKKLDRNTEAVIDGQRTSMNVVNSEDYIAALGNDNIVGGKAYIIYKYKSDKSTNTTTFVVDGDENISKISSKSAVTAMIGSTGIRFGELSGTPTFATGGTKVVVNGYFHDPDIEQTIQLDSDGWYVLPSESENADTYNYLVFPDARDANGMLIGTTNIGSKGLAVGYNNIAWSQNSTTFGRGNSAEGNFSFVSGVNNIGGHSSVVGGSGNTAIGDCAASSGMNNKALGNYSHTEGVGNTASGVASHAEGGDVHADGDYSHAEGNQSEAVGESSHAEGHDTYAESNNSHSEGYKTKALGENSHAEGNSTIASGPHSHSEGVYKELEDGTTKYTVASGVGSHAEGEGCEASGVGSHSEGSESSATGDYSHAEGNKSTASENSAHAEGYSTSASGPHSHSEGSGTNAIGDSSHAEGKDTTAEGINSHSGGEGSHAKGSNSFAHGNHVNADGEDQVVLGKYNENKDTNAFEIGYGTSDGDRKNLFEVKKSGSLTVGQMAVPRMDNQMETVISTAKEQPQPESGKIIIWIDTSMIE